MSHSENMFTPHGGEADGVPAAKRPRTRVVAACVLAVILAAVAGFSSYRAAIVSKGIDQLTYHALLKPGKGISSVELCGQWYHDGVLVGQLPIGSARLPLRLDVAMEGTSHFEDGVMTIAPLDELKKCLPIDNEAGCSYVSSGPVTSGSIPVTAGGLYCVGFAARSDAESLVVPLPEEITADPARLTSLSCDVYVVWACFSDGGTGGRFADPALAKELGWALFYFTDMNDLKNWFICAFGGTGKLYDYTGFTTLMSNIWLLIAAGIASTPVLRKGYRWFADKCAALNILVTPVLVVALLAFCFILLVGESYNPFLYFRF